MRRITGERGSRWPSLQRSYRKNSLSGESTCFIGCVCVYVCMCECVRMCVCVCVHHPRKLIVDNFIPVAEVEKIKGRAVLNPETDEWTLTPVKASDRLSQYMNTFTVCVIQSVLLYYLLCLQFRHSCSQTSVKSRQSQTHVNLCQDSRSNRKPKIHGSYTTIPLPHLHYSPLPPLRLRTY